MHRIRLITDPFDLAAYSEHYSYDVLAFLQSQFDTFPETARLYHNTISVDNDITPQTEEDVEALAIYEDESLFYVVVYPGDPITAIVAVVATLALTAVILLFLTPRIPSLTNNTESSNNSLGNRVNKPRPNGRIPDIFGSVISIPELLTVPLLYFQDNLERELCYMCVGRGDHAIEDVKDGDTPITQIAGAAAKFYGPNTGPNFGIPILEVGGDINQPLMDVVKLNDVNGQILRAPNANRVSGDDDIRFVYPDRIERQGSAIDFTTFFQNGDQLTINSSTFDFPASTVTADASSRFVYPNLIEFAAWNPAPSFGAGMQFSLTGASYAGQSKSGGTTFVDLDGTYTINAVVQYTNVQRFSEDMGNVGITKTSATVAANAKIAPDGNLTADKINEMETVANTEHQLELATVAFSSGTQYRFTIYLAPGERTQAAVILPYAAGLFDPGLGFFELIGAGTASGSGLDSSSIELLPNGWYKCSIVATAIANGTGRMTVGIAEAGDNVYPGVAGSGIYAWGAMTQASGDPRPYIPTGAAAASRYYMTLQTPATTNTDWNLLNTFYEEQTTFRNSNFSRTIPASSLNLNGTYNAVSVSAGTIVLTNPALVNPTWNNIQGLPGGATPYGSPTISTSGERWVGPFVVDMPTCDRVLSNIVALQGMYLVTKKGKYRPRSVTVAVEITPVGSDDLPNGPSQTFNIAVSGDGKDRSPQGVSLWANMGFTGRCRVRARRLTYLNLETEDTIVDEVKWRDCFGTSIITQAHFGDVTTLHSLTLATSGATAVKERKLNCRATRKVLQRNTDNTFGPELVASTNAADIICHMTIDPYIGGRPSSELDVDQIYETIDEVTSYFGLAQAGSFGYTFDQENVSYEELAQSVAQAVFCTAYRQGSTLRLSFERETEDSTLLFNHRNKTPGSETRTVSFGYLNDNDGVEFDYISPDDGSKMTLYRPADQSATKPKKLETIGVQSEEHAFLHASRAWNKIQYQNTTTQFTALSEATQLVLTERIEVTDNTRPDVFDGEILSQEGLVLELSQPFIPAPGRNYTIHLQLPSGSVEAIDISVSGISYALEQSPAALFDLSIPEQITKTGGTSWQGMWRASVPYRGNAYLKFRLRDKASGPFLGFSANDELIDSSNSAAMKFTYAVAVYPIVSTRALNVYTNYGENITTVLPAGTMQDDDIIEITQTGTRTFDISVNGAVVHTATVNDALPIAWVKGHLYLNNATIDQLVIAGEKATTDEDEFRFISLQSAPSEALVTSQDMWAVTTYQIVDDKSGRTSAFLLTEKGTYDKKTLTVQAINYDARYYQDDKTFVS